MKRHTERFGEYGRTINGLLFCTAIDRRNVRYPVLAEEAPHAALAPLGKGPLWDRNRRINYDLRMRDEIDMARHLSILLPGRAGGYPSGPPTDPHVRNERMRFLRQSLSYPSILSRRGVVTRWVSAKSLSCIVPPGTLCPTSPSLSWVAWASLPHLRRYSTPLRLPPVLLGVLRLALVPRSLAGFPRSWSPRRA